MNTGDGFLDNANDFLEHIGLVSQHKVGRIAPIIQNQIWLKGVYVLVWFKVVRLV